MRALLFTIALSGFLGVGPVEAQYCGSGGGRGAWGGGKETIVGGHPRGYETPPRTTQDSTALPGYYYGASNSGRAPARQGVTRPGAARSSQVVKPKDGWMPVHYPQGFPKVLQPARTR